MFYFFIKSIIQIHNRLEVSLSVCSSVLLFVRPSIRTVSSHFHWSIPKGFRVSLLEGRLCRVNVSITEEYRVSCLCS